VPEVLADVEEISGSAADIEDPLAPAQIEPEVADSLEVNLHPSLDFEIFRPLVAGVMHRVAIVNLLELLAVDRLGDSGGIES
jgi:hypothetical protein